MKKRKSIIIAVVLIIAIFAITINALFPMRDSKEESTVVAETLDKDDATPATISSTKEENYQ